MPAPTEERDDAADLAPVAAAPARAEPPVTHSGFEALRGFRSEADAREAAAAEAATQAAAAGAEASADASLEAEAEAPVGETAEIGRTDTDESTAAVTAPEPEGSITAADPDAPETSPTAPGGNVEERPAAEPPVMETSGAALEAAEPPEGEIAAAEPAEPIADGPSASDPEEPPPDGGSRPQTSTRSEEPAETSQ